MSSIRLKWLVTVQPNHIGNTKTLKKWKKNNNEKTPNTQNSFNMQHRFFLLCFAFCPRPPALFVFPHLFPPCSSTCLYKPDFHSTTLPDNSVMLQLLGVSRFCISMCSISSSDRCFLLVSTSWPAPCFHSLLLFLLLVQLNNNNIFLTNLYSPQFWGPD